MQTTITRSRETRASNILVLSVSLFTSQIQSPGESCSKSLTIIILVWRHIRLNFSAQRPSSCTASTLKASTSWNWPSFSPSGILSVGLVGGKESTNCKNCSGSSPCCHTSRAKPWYCPCFRRERIILAKTSQFLVFVGLLKCFWEMKWQRHKRISFKIAWQKKLATTFALHELLNSYHHLMCLACVKFFLEVLFLCHTILLIFPKIVVHFSSDQCFFLLPPPKYLPSDLLATCVPEGRFLYLTCLWNYITRAIKRSLEPQHLQRTAHRLILNSFLWSCKLHQTHADSHKRWCNNKCTKQHWTWDPDRWIHNGRRKLEHCSSGIADPNEMRWKKGYIPRWNTSKSERIKNCHVFFE